jgi:DNA-binding MarR family transcriptional regulator
MGTSTLRRELNGTREVATLKTWLRLLACTNLIEKRIRAQLRCKFATTLPRFDVLAQLDAADRDLGKGLTLSELSHRLMVTNGNLTGLTERLVQERLVNREDSPTDRRTQYVRLTPAGRRALNSMLPDHRTWISEMFAGLQDPDLSELYELLGKLKNSVSATREEEE